VIHPDREGGVSRGHSSPGRDEGLNGEEWRVGSGTHERQAAEYPVRSGLSDRGKGEAPRAVQEVTESLAANRRAESQGIRLPRFTGGR
jgi:hypothetical protein